MLLAALYSPTIERGVSYGLPCTWSEGGEPVDLGDYEIRAEIRTGVRRGVNQIVDRSDVIDSFEVEILDAAAGSFSISLTPEQTAALPVGDLPWDLLAISTERTVRLIQGELHVSEWVSEPELIS